ncbi:hypothetical protein CLF_104879 [Clonorchis sinensis]|uniref:Uncharacterized protein n=1 Tax=Clonorchis sinensis TaxID=79923 RepID=H2KQW0_CLOSI|nr:hypothetical protein CLF_104879 [Clonorchis sinensis]
MQSYGTEHGQFKHLAYPADEDLETLNDVSRIKDYVIPASPHFNQPHKRHRSHSSRRRSGRHRTTERVVLQSTIDDHTPRSARTREGSRDRSKHNASGRQRQRTATGEPGRKKGRRKSTTSARREKELVDQYLHSQATNDNSSLRDYSRPGTQKRKEKPEHNSYADVTPSKSSQENLGLTENSQKTFSIKELADYVIPEKVPLKEGTYNLIRFPLRAVAIMVELQLFWWFIQFSIFIWITTLVDWKLRIRSPISEFPKYSAPRMPILPGQEEMRNRLLGVWLTLGFVYLPSTVIHLSKFFDDTPHKQKRRRLSRIPSPIAWYEKDHYKQLVEIKQRQPRAMWMLILTFGLLLYYIYVFFSDTFYPMQEIYWDNIINKWLYELQRYYFLQFQQLAQFIRPESRIPSHHTPDDGSGTYLSLDLIHRMFECCGRKTGYTDWNSPHVYRPKNHTYRKAMGIPLLYERAHYLMPTLTNDSVPFSCCNPVHTEDVLKYVPCDHILVSNPSDLYNRGCVKPLSQFIRIHWMGVHLFPLLIVIITMIPQLVLYLATLQPKQLRIQLKKEWRNLLDWIMERRRWLQILGRDMLSMLSRSSMSVPLGGRGLELLKEDLLEDDYYKIIRADVAASEREIYGKRKGRSKDRKRKRDKAELPKYSNIKPSSHLESRQSQHTSGGSYRR